VILDISRYSLPSTRYLKCILLVMRNIRLTIEYDGTDFFGWQIQSRHQQKTIQDTIEKALQKILQEKVKLIASGRTDSGVHALAQVANFKTHSQIALEQLQKALNALLPAEITIIKTEELDLDFHSRFDVQSKVYRYLILNRPHRSSFLRNRVYFYPYPLDVGLIQDEAKVLLGRHDFKAFCASGSNTKDTIRRIKKIAIKKLPYLPWGVKDNPKKLPLIVIDIEANGFLYNMVRNIIGTLIEIGRKKLAKGGLKRILKSKDRRFAGPTAPAQGLYLLEVRY